MIVSASVCDLFCFCGCLILKMCVMWSSDWWMLQIFVFILKMILHLFEQKKNDSSIDSICVWHFSRLMSVKTLIFLWPICKLKAISTDEKKRKTKNFNPFNGGTLMTLQISIWWWIFIHLFYRSTSQSEMSHCFCLFKNTIW